MFNTALAMAATLVSLAFGLCTLDRWLNSRRPHELAWTIAFALFMIAALFMAAGSQSTWNSFLFRGFYLFGAIISVPVLGLGTLFLLTSHQIARWATIATFAFAFFSIGVIGATGITAPVPTDRLPQGSDVFEPLPRLLAALGSSIGAMVVLGGTIFSAIRRPQFHNILGNLLIACGTLTMGASGLLNSIGDEMTAFSITLVAGLLIIFSGFGVLTAKQRPSPALLKQEGESSMTIS